MTSMVEEPAPEPEMVLRIISSSKKIVTLLNQFSELLNAVYPLLGSSVVFETIHNGTIMYFNKVQDLIQFHKVAKMIPLKKPEKNGKPCSLHVIAERIPKDHDMRELMPVVIEAYASLSSEVEVKQTGPREAEIYYHNDQIFEDILVTIRDVLGKKLDE